MSEPKTDTATLITALRILSHDIESGDGVANACIAEGAERIEELRDENKEIRKIVGQLGRISIDLRKRLDEIANLARKGDGSSSVNDSCAYFEKIEAIARGESNE